MKIAFISITASSNNLSSSQMLRVSILVKEDGEIVSELQSYIKPVPSLSITEKELLEIDYSILRFAPPLCDIASDFIEMIESTNTVFIDKFSERIFKKAFRNIGYPMGAATYIVEKIFKDIFRSAKPFNLESAIESLELDREVLTDLDNSRALEKIFSKLELMIGNEMIPILIPSENSKNIQMDLSLLPNHPGIYLFRNSEGEIIYVGKAKNIAKRVRSHFTSASSFERNLCLQTAIIDFEETGSETIALLLESHYITSLKPKFNTQQKDIINPYIITSKTDSKGILRIQLIQKSYKDSENEFYYNRESVLKKIIEVQQKFKLCKRYTGIERTASRCSDPLFCQGICEGLESEEDYNKRVKIALEYIYSQRPSYIIKLKGRNPFEDGFVLVKHGIYQGFGFIDSQSTINSKEDIESFTKHYTHNYFTSRIIDQHFKNHKSNSENVMAI